MDMNPSRFTDEQIIGGAIQLANLPIRLSKAPILLTDRSILLTGPVPLPRDNQGETAAAVQPDQIASAPILVRAWVFVYALSF
jgi:hypothetical protein